MHENKFCPCCNEVFECKAGSITICQCMEVAVSASAKELISKKYDDCLCKYCLLKIEEDATKASADNNLF